MRREGHETLPCPPFNGFLWFSSMAITSAQPVRQWSVLSLLEWTSTHLAEKKIDEARLTVELLLAHTLGLRRLDLYLQFDRPLTQKELAAFRQLYERRLAHEPVQYIIGETEFMGHPFAVDRHALIPRPETEHLVEYALEQLRASGQETPRILEVGSGSGNVAIALALRLRNASVDSMDIHPETLALAQRNNDRNDAHVHFVQADVFDEVFSGDRFDLIISNPPYVSAKEFELLQIEVRDFEPRDAICDDGDGLRFYRRFMEFAPPRLRESGLLAVEVGFGQADPVARLFRDAGLADVEMKKDYAGINRIVAGRKKRSIAGDAA